jgi:hypothetical protein
MCRRDPGVKFVEHNTVPDLNFDRNVGKVEPAPPPLKSRSPLSKRWKTWEGTWFWSIGQVNSWGVRDDIKNNQKAGWFNSEILHTAGLGVDVYVMDDGVSIPPNTRRILERKGPMIGVHDASKVGEQAAVPQGKPIRRCLNRQYCA